MIDGLGNEGGDVAISLCPFIDWAIVLYGSQLAIFLFDEKEVCCIWAPQLTDHTPLQMLGYKFLCFSNFALG